MRFSKFHQLVLTRLAQAGGIMAVSEAATSPEEGRHMWGLVHHGYAEVEGEAPAEGEEDTRVVNLTPQGMAAAGIAVESKAPAADANVKPAPKPVEVKEKTKSKAAVKTT